METTIEHRVPTQYDFYLTKCYEVAQESRDPSTQNGALIIVGNTVITAANNFPPFVAENAERWERPAKYKFVEHAERGATFKAARLGLSTDGSTMVSVWAACADCARAIVLSGISTLVRHERNQKAENARWYDSIAAGDEILIEGGVQIVEIPPITGWKLRRDEKLVDTAEL